VQLLERAVEVEEMVEDLLLLDQDLQMLQEQSMLMEEHMVLMEQVDKMVVLVETWL
jgi:hypothetical protein